MRVETREDGTWRHVVLTWDPVTYRLYTDGEFRKSFTPNHKVRNAEVSSVFQVCSPPYNVIDLRRPRSVVPRSRGFPGPPEGGTPNDFRARARRRDLKSITLLRRTRPWMRCSCTTAFWVRLRCERCTTACGSTMRESAPSRQAYAST